MRLLRRHLAASRRVAVAFARAQGGGPAAEFALVAPIFIALIFATIQCAIIFIGNSYLETATEAAARTVLTNNATTTTNGTTTAMDAAHFHAAVCANMPALFTCSSVLVGLQPATSMTSISTATPAFNSDGTLKSSLPYQLPQPGQIGVLQVLYQWPVLGLPLGVNFANLGNGTYLMVSTQVFMVEQQ